MNRRESFSICSLQHALPLAILLAAFCVRASVAAYWHAKAESEQRLFRLGDSHSYWILAGHVARGEPYEYGSSDSKIFRAPAYPILLAPFTLYSDEAQGVWYARLAGCLLGTVAVTLVMIIGRRLGGWTAGCWAGALAAVYPGAVGMSVVVLSEAIFCPLMLANILAWQIAYCANSRTTIVHASCVAGIAAGLGILARPSWLLFAPLLAGIGIVCGRNRYRHWLIFVISALACSLAMSPWWIRNAFITGRFVPTTLQVGPSLYDGLHAGATGGSDEGMSFAVEHANRLLAEDSAGQASPESALAHNDVFEYRLNKRLTRLAWEWSVDNPGQALWLAGVKFSKVWSLWPDGKEVGSTWLRLALTGGCLAVMSLAIAGSRRLLVRSGWLAMICWLPTIYFTVLHMVFVGSVRYREPAILTATVLAGCALAGFVENWRVIKGKVSQS